MYRDGFYRVVMILHVFDRRVHSCFNALLSRRTYTYILLDDIAKATQKSILIALKQTHVHYPNPNPASSGRVLSSGR
jgi:hypothetical protein